MASSDSVSDALLTLSAYRLVLAQDLHAASNLGTLPEDVKVEAKGGLGPRWRLLLFGDEKGVRGHKSMTACEKEVRAGCFAGVDSIEITTASHGFQKKVEGSLGVRELSFASYHSTLAVLADLVVVHERPLEWAAVWVLRHRHELRLYDCYTSFTAPRRFPLRPGTAAAVLIALEGHNVGAYVKGSSPRVLDTSGAVLCEGDLDAEQCRGVPADGKSGARDAIPIPLLYLRRSSKSDADGAPQYYACSGLSVCEEAIRVCHLRLGGDSPPMKSLSAGDVARLVERLLESHVFLPIPYLRVSEASRAKELVDPWKYGRVGDAYVFEGSR